MMYKVGLPFWRVAGRLGVPLKVIVCIHEDKEAGVFLAHGCQLKGLVVEAATLDELRVEVGSAADALLERECYGHHAVASPEMRLSDRALCAA